MLARYYRAAHRLEEARALEREGVALFPGNARAQITLGYGFLDDGMDRKALRIAARILSADARDSDAHDLRSRALDKQNDGEGALASAREARNLEPGNKRLHSSLIGLLLRARCYGEALEEGLRAAAKFPYNTFFQTQIEDARLRLLECEA